MADTSETSNSWGGLIEMPQHQVMQVAVLGLGLGFGAWVVGLLVKQVVIVPLFCGDPAANLCVNAASTADNAASIIIAFIGLMGLVRLSVFRPLLIVLAALISLWGIGNWTASLQWYEALAWTIALYTLCYVTFAWLVRPRLLAPALLLLVVGVSAIRWLPVL